MPQADDAALRQAFLDARTQNAWQPKDVPDSLLRQLIDIVKMGPTSANCLPARFVFVKSKEAKEKLKPFLSEGNRDKTMQAPVCAIIGYDLDFYEHLPKLFPHKDMKSRLRRQAGQDQRRRRFATARLQGGYLIIAARLLGLDCGPMSGFDNAGVDAAFFAGTSVKSNFLCNLGYGDASAAEAALCRGFSFDEMAKII